ncbi:MAG: VWA domain-containing protein [Terriglobales bacterium]
MGPSRALVKCAGTRTVFKPQQKCLYKARHTILGAVTVACFAALALLSASAQNPSQAPPPGPPVSTPQSPSITPDNNGTAAGQNSASQDPQGDAGQFVFRKQVEEVILHAVVVDQQNDLIANLPQSEFRVYEDGKPQEITSFHQERVPVALGILIDNSGSMRPKREAVNQAALNLARSSDPQDEIFIVNFGEEYYLDQDFTNDVSKLQAALGKIETRGSTALYDTIVASAAHMKQNAGLQKQVLLVVTDGEDNASQESLEETMQQLQQRDSPVVYMIALLNPGKRTSSTIRSLQAISQNTGGAAYFPADVQEVEAITRRIASDIRSQYVIGYKSSSTTTGHKYHAIEVEAYDGNQRKLRVRTRTGYYSDSASGAP